MQYPLIVLNWKMNPGTLAEAKVLKAETQRGAKKFKGSVIITPPSIFLRELAGGKGSVSYGAQNIHEEISGSHTGDVSVVQMKDAGAQWALIGHAERRALDDTDERIQKKIQTALSVGVRPIVCVGEKERDEHGGYFEVVRSQIHAAVTEFPKQKLKQLVIAYEPVWAIGATKPMSTHEMHEMSIFIRKVLSELYGKAGLMVPVLYGGSIDAESAPVMLQEGDVQGLLVGRASVDSTTLKALLHAIQV